MKESSSMSLNTPGTLFVVATPIGNLDDITIRALSVLKNVDLIAAEDTRYSYQLLKHYNIHTRMVSLHEYNEDKKSSFILEQLLTGKNIALISDAGTPLISDPGYRLVAMLRNKNINIKVCPIPGPSALIAALCSSGLPTDRFVFEGFLSPRKSRQLLQLKQLADETRTMVFYESPHRIVSTITNMTQVFGQKRRAVLAKELTKTFETFRSETLEEIQKWLSNSAENQKGEFVLLVHGEESNSAPIIDKGILRIFNILAQELPKKQALSLTTKITGIKKNSLYDHIF